MESESDRNPESRPVDPEAHIKIAHEILKGLQKKIGEHPEIGAAITKLEMALNDLAIQTGGRAVVDGRIEGSQQITREKSSR